MEIKQDDHVLEIQDGFIDVNEIFVRMKEWEIIEKEDVNYE